MDKLLHQLCQQYFAHEMKPRMPSIYECFGDWSKGLMIHLKLCVVGGEHFMKPKDAEECLCYSISLAASKSAEPQYASNITNAYDELDELCNKMDEIDNAILSGKAIDKEIVKRAIFLVGRTINYIENQIKEAGG